MGPGELCPTPFVFSPEVFNTVVRTWLKPLDYRYSSVPAVRMKTLYNRIAGQSVERLEALSDGVSAIAMTLLVLDIHLPAAGVHSEPDMWRVLAA